jgi:Lon protease-like protein
LKRYQTIAELPAQLPVFPLGGALLLPRTELPLNIFEQRYLVMFERAMSTDRLVGMIQPLESKSAIPELQRIGCVGRVTSYAETEDNRLMVVLTGICRFDWAREKKVKTPYRQLDVSYDGFAADLVIDNAARNVDRDGVVKAFRNFLDANSMSANWEEVEKVSTETLVNNLSQMAPYPIEEKQALLEAPDLKSRAEMLIALTELALSKNTTNSLQ